MKLSISTWYLENRFGYRKAFEMIKDAGFDALYYNIDERSATAEDFLSTKAYRMSEDNASSFDIRLAQLLYCAFIADTEYRADGIDLLTSTVSDNSESFGILKESLYESFGVDISSNRIIEAYYKGITEFNEGGEE